MYASNSHSYTHLILALGIVRKPTVWGFITSEYPGTHDIGLASNSITARMKRVQEHSSPVNVLVYKPSYIVFNKRHISFAENEVLYWACGIWSECDPLARTEFSSNNLGSKLDLSLMFEPLT